MLDSAVQSMGARISQKDRRQLVSKLSGISAYNRKLCAYFLISGSYLQTWRVSRHDDEHQSLTS